MINEKPLILGVDIGGSHISVGFVDLETRRVIPGTLMRSAINALDEADIILNSWCSLINEAFNGTDITLKRIGIAIPGPFNYENGICLINEQDKFQSLYQKNIKNELSLRLNIPHSNISFINDAAGFLKGEIFAGTAINSNNVLGITLGTGLGSAISINGLVEDAALWDSVFLNGIAEDYLSARWFIERYHELTGENVDGVKELYGFRDEDPSARQVFNEFGLNLALFIIPIIIKYKLDMVIIGGNISLAFNAFSNDLYTCLNASHIKVTIKISELKENAALIGATVEKCN